MRVALAYVCEHTEGGEEERERALYISHQAGDKASSLISCL